MNHLRQPVGAEPDQSKYKDFPEMSPALKEPGIWRRLHARKRGVHVTEGYFVCRRLRYNSQYREVPEYSSAITSLCISPSGEVFGATSGDMVHIFAYNPTPPFDTVAKVVALPGETDCRRALVWEKHETVIVGTRAPLNRPTPADFKGGSIYRIAGGGFIFDAVQEWPLTQGKAVKLATPVPGEGIAALAIDNKRQRLYGLTDKTGVFFVYDLAADKLDVRKPLDPIWHFSENLMITPDGVVVTTAAAGRIARYTPDTDQFELTDEFVPTYPGRSIYARIDSWAYEPQSDLFYVGDKADGLLYTLNPRTLETRLIGKPASRIRVRAMAATPDGRIFGMAGQHDDIAQMFIYEPATGQLRDLGIPLATIEERRYGFEFDSAVAGPNGQIYFGESEVQSRLFIYFPAILPPPSPAETKA